MRRGWKTAAVTALILAVGAAFPASAAPAGMGSGQGIYDTRDYELSIYDVRWDGETGYAQWTDTEDAHRYELKVYRGKKRITTALLYATATSYDLREYITQEGTYSFQVRAVYSSSHKGDWFDSGDWEVDEETAKKFRDFTGRANESGEPENAGEWIKEGSRWWYRNRDGSYMKDNWQYIDNKWYFFDSEGYMETGWIKWKDHSYYCGKDGAMWASCWTPDGYYVDGDGAWVQGYSK